MALKVYAQEVWKIACLFLLQLMDQNDISDEDKLQIHQLYVYGRATMALHIANKDDNNLLLSAFLVSFFRVGIYCGADWDSLS